MWHTERAHTPPADLAGVPLEYIVGVELNDADAEQVGTLFEDTSWRGLPSGRERESFRRIAVLGMIRTDRD